jgi:hypothetical protein
MMIDTIQKTLIRHDWRDISPITPVGTRIFTKQRTDKKPVILIFEKQKISRILDTHLTYFSEYEFLSNQEIAALLDVDTAFFDIIGNEIPFEENL